MQSLKDDKMLKFRPDTLEAVRKDINLVEVARIEESIDILENWIQKQTHFGKKDFSREYLERTLMTCKGLVERSKERLDKLCTFRTLMPEFFEITAEDKQGFKNIEKLQLQAHMPNLTPDHYRVLIVQIRSDNVDSTVIFNLIKYFTALAEYFKKVEYVKGFVIITDYRELNNIISYATKAGARALELNKFITMMVEGYGLRVKAIHVITPSKMVDALVTVLKQMFSTKLASRFHIHKDIETVYDFVPKEVMPADYGGNEKPLWDLNQDWIEAVTSKEFMAYAKEMNKAKTNESFRNNDSFNEHYIGMPGSFRVLNLD